MNYPWSFFDHWNLILWRIDLRGVLILILSPVLRCFGSNGSVAEQPLPSPFSHFPFLFDWLLAPAGQCTAFIPPLPLFISPILCPCALTSFILSKLGRSRAKNIGNFAGILRTHELNSLSLSSLSHYVLCKTR